MTGTNDLELDRGDHETFTIDNLRAANGDETTLLAGDRLRWTAKRYLSQPDDEAFLILTANVEDGPGGITIAGDGASAHGTIDAAWWTTAPTNDDGDAHFTPLGELGADIEFRWDLQLVPAGDDQPTTLASGNGIVRADVSRTAP